MCCYMKRYQNKSQHRKLTMEKKILSQLLEPATFESQVGVWRSNHKVNLVLSSRLAVTTQKVRLLASAACVLHCLPWFYFVHTELYHVTSAKPSPCHVSLTARTALQDTVRSYQIVPFMARWNFPFWSGEGLQSLLINQNVLSIHKLVTRSKHADGYKKDIEFN